MSWILKSDDKEIIAAPAGNPDPEVASAKKRQQQAQEAKKQTILEELDKVNSITDPDKLAKALNEVLEGKIGETIINPYTERTLSPEQIKKMKDEGKDPDTVNRHSISEDAKLLAKALNNSLVTLMSDQEKELYEKAKNEKNVENKKVLLQELEKMLIASSKKPGSRFYQAYIALPNFRKDMLDELYQNKSLDIQRDYPKVTQFYTSSSGLKALAFERAVKEWISKLMPSYKAEDYTPEERARMLAETFVEQETGMTSKKPGKDELETALEERELQRQGLGFTEEYTKLIAVEQDKANKIDEIKKMAITMYSQMLKSKEHKAIKQELDKLNEIAKQSEELRNKIEKDTGEAVKNIKIVSENGRLYSSTQKTGAGMVAVNNFSKQTKAYYALASKAYQDRADQIVGSAYTPFRSKFNEGITEQTMQKEEVHPKSTKPSTEPMKKKESIIILATDDAGSEVVDLFSNTNEKLSKYVEGLQSLSNMMEAQAEQTAELADATKNPEVSESTIKSIFTKLNKSIGSFWTKLKSFFGVKSSYLGDNTWLK